MWDCPEVQHCVINDVDVDAGIDADIVMKVTSLPAASSQCEGLLAGATAYLVENTTLRPIYGLILMCKVDESKFGSNLATTVHEVLHALVRACSGLWSVVVNSIHTDC